ncbi:hypothetical protein D3C81_1553160 [compost metagenome]
MHMALLREPCQPGDQFMQRATHTEGVVDHDRDQPGDFFVAIHGTQQQFIIRQAGVAATQFGNPWQQHRRCGRHLAGAVGEHKSLDVVIDRQRQCAEVAAHVLLHFVGNHLVALAAQYVHHRLRGNHGGEGRGHHGRAQFHAHARDLFEDHRQLVGDPRQLQLRL